MKRSRIIVPILFLVWTVMGLLAFATQWTMDLDQLAKHDPYQAKIFADMPMWTWVAYAVAVLSAFSGAVALLMKRASAVPLFTVSLLGVLIQFSYTFLMTDLLAMRGPTTAIFPAFIISMAVIMLLYARSQTGAGRLR
ncbi:MAG: sugar transporter [Sphingobium sp.]